MRKLEKKGKAKQTSSLCRPLTGEQRFRNTAPPMNLKRERKKIEAKCRISLARKGPNVKPRGLTYRFCSKLAQMIGIDVVV